MRLADDVKYSEQFGSLVVSTEHSSLLPNHILKYRKRALDFLANFCENYKFQHNKVDGIQTIRFPIYEGTRCTIRKIKRVVGLNDLPKATAHFQVILKDTVLANSFMSLSNSYKQISPYQKKLLKKQQLIEQKVLQSAKTIKPITKQTLISNGDELCFTVAFYKRKTTKTFPVVHILDEKTLWAQLLEYKQTVEHNQVKRANGKIDKYKNLKYVWVDTPNHYLKKLYNHIIVDTRVEWHRTYQSKSGKWRKGFEGGYPR